MERGERKEIRVRERERERETEEREDGDAGAEAAVSTSMVLGDIPTLQRAPFDHESDPHSLRGPPSPLATLPLPDRESVPAVGQLSISVHAPQRLQPGLYERHAT